MIWFFFWCVVAWKRHEMQDNYKWEWCSTPCEIWWASDLINTMKNTVVEVHFMWANIFVYFHHIKTICTVFGLIWKHYIPALASDIIVKGSISMRQKPTAKGFNFVFKLVSPVKYMDSLMMSWNLRHKPIWHCKQRNDPFCLYTVTICHDFELIWKHSISAIRILKLDLENVSIFLRLPCVLFESFNQKNEVCKFAYMMKTDIFDSNIQPLWNYSCNIQIGGM